MTRMLLEFWPRLLAFFCMVFVPFLSVREAHADDARPNVLFIAIDDLNDWLGCMSGHPQVQSPHFDRLAGRGVLFMNAHCAAPVCGPSRTSLMTGQMPATSGIYSNNANVRRMLPEALTLPQDLRRQGYQTLGCGKLFHGNQGHPEDAFDHYGPFPDAVGTSGGPFTTAELLLTHQTPFHVVRRGDQTFRLPLSNVPADRDWRSTNTFDWGPVDLPDDQFSDTLVNRWAVEKLASGLEEPFFLGVGYFRPHQPMYNPKRFHDLYPLESIQLPPTIAGDLYDLSRSGKDYALIPATSGSHRSVVQSHAWKSGVASYLASISYVDWLLGQLLDALDRSGHTDNTAIVLFSDHGWHLGEKHHWGKATGWYRATRVPMIVVPPKNRSPEGFTPGRQCERAVNLLDLYPTIIEMIGLPKREKAEGNSLVPLIADPTQAWQEHTVTTFGRGNHAISTERWRLIQYFDAARELYDREADPHEWHNLAGLPEYARVIERLASFIPEEPQWKHFVRLGNFKAVVPSDGGAMLLFDHAKHDHLEERQSEAGDHGEIVERIERYLAEHPESGRHVVIAP